MVSSGSGIASIASTMIGSRFLQAISVWSLSMSSNGTNLHQSSSSLSRTMNPVLVLKTLASVNGTSCSMWCLDSWSL